MPVNDNGNEVLRKAAIVDPTGGYHLKILNNAGTALDPNVKYVEAVYTLGDTVITYSFYESSSKVTLYNTIITTFTESQDNTFSNAEWI
jgi:hypothetical protein